MNAEEKLEAINEARKKRNKTIFDATIADAAKVVGKANHTFFNETVDILEDKKPNIHTEQIFADLELLLQQTQRSTSHLIEPEYLADLIKEWKGESE